MAASLASTIPVGDIPPKKSKLIKASAAFSEC